MGWGCSVVLLNSGWNWVPMKKGCEGISMISTNAAMMPLPRDEPPSGNEYILGIHNIIEKEVRDISEAAIGRRRPASRVDLRIRAPGPFSAGRR